MKKADKISISVMTLLGGILLLVFGILGNRQIEADEIAKMKMAEPVISVFIWSVIIGLFLLIVSVVLFITATTAKNRER